jgi:pimeloyl-ACP methyl ester carboxylesterase
MSLTGKKRLIRILMIISALYIAGGIILYFAQDLLLFHPKPMPADHKYVFDQPFEELNIDAGKRNLNIVKFKPNHAAKGVVLYFHGNMKNIERYAPVAPLFTNEGYELWMMDYPGFGKSTGKRTEENIYRDADTLYDLASKIFSPEQIIIYGRSLGTGVASQLASRRPGNKLILETPYYSMHELARSYFPVYPVGLLLKYRFPVSDYLKEVKIPVYLIHGNCDEVVPYSQSVKIRKAKPSAHLITIRDGNHNDLAEFEIFKSTIKRLLYTE